MSALSTGVEIAWQIAAGETAHGRLEFIDPEHLFIGLCSLKKALQPEALRHLALTSNQVGALRSEWSALGELWAEFQLDPAALRRELRQRKGEGTFDHQAGVVHRSPASREAFERAAAL